MEASTTMGELDVNTALQLQIAGFGAVGAITATRFIVAYLKRLLNIHGRGVMFVTLACALYVVGTAMLTQYYPVISVVFSIVYMAVVVAATADAMQLQDEEVTRERDKEEREQEQEQEFAPPEHEHV